MNILHPGQLQKKILGAVLKLPTKQYRQLGHWPSFEVNGLDWRCCLAGSSKTGPRILILLIAMVADYALELVSIET